MQGKLKFRFYILLFSVAIFILTAVGLAGFVYKTLVMPFWLFFVYVFAWGLVLAFAVDFFVANAKMGWEKFLIFILIVMVLSIPVTHSVWIIVTPRWSFSVTTNKFTYRLGENVTITVSLRNTGFITHSFKSSVSDPVVVTVTNTYYSSWWWSGYNRSITEFSLGPNDSLERDFIWNQTTAVSPSEWKQISPGRYYVIASIPDAESHFIDPLSEHNIFAASTSINVTSP